MPAGAKALTTRPTCEPDFRSYTGSFAGVTNSSHEVK
jgi:hypothetical protein